MSEQAGRAHRPEAVLRIRGEAVFWGPGLRMLLAHLERTGSIRTAAAEMYMSYSKARRLISLAEKELGFALVRTSRGGRTGGSTVLTQEGRAYYRMCCRLQEEVQQFCEERYAYYMTQDQ